MGVLGTGTVGQFRLPRWCWCSEEHSSYVEHSPGMALPVLRALGAGGQLAPAMPSYPGSDGLDSLHTLVFPGHCSHSDCESGEELQG